MSAEREMYERIFMAEERKRAGGARSGTSPLPHFSSSPLRAKRAKRAIPLNAKKRRQLLRWAHVELTKPAHSFEERQTQAAAKFIVQRYATFEGKRSLKKPVARSR